MDRFIITDEPWTSGFQCHARLDINNPIEPQLNRERFNQMNYILKNDLRRLVEKNSSLRIAFGWSFESASQFYSVMNDCISEVIPKYNMFFGTMVSDTRCDWLGFPPLNTFEKIIYEDLDIDGLALFNNELINFQIDVLDFISKHKIFKQHSLLRDPSYRFGYYKKLRNNPHQLEEAFHYYIDTMKDMVGPIVLRQFIEEDIGCHYLNYPDIFFELLEFYKLKGIIHE